MSMDLLEREEGLGTVYERHRLWKLIDRLDEKYRFRSVLETPLGRMSGLSGPNPVRFVSRGIPVVQADPSYRTAQEAARLWRLLRGTVLVTQSEPPLPFRDGAFDIVLSFHGVGQGSDAEKTVRDLYRICGRILLIIQPNESVCHKMGLNKKGGGLPFGHVLRILEQLPGAVVEQGFLDCPPWPDTGFAIKERLPGNVGRRSRVWRWSTLDFLKGEAPSQKTIVRRLSFLEDGFPEKFKSLWAHHRYLVYEIFR